MLSHLPVWPFAVLLVLIALGIWQSRSRVVSPIAPAVLAVAFLLYSIYGVVSSFGATLSALGPWVAAVLLSVVAGRPAFGPPAVTRLPETRKIQLPGSWLPLALMMGIFVVKFIVGFVEGARLPGGQQAWFAPAASFLLGALSGGFASRAVTIRRLAHGAAGDA